MKRKYVLIAVAVVVVGTVGYYIVGNGKTNGGTAQPVGQTTRIVTVSRGNLDLTVSADGVVQPIDKVEIRSKAGGRIEQLNFEEGQVVQKGALLISLDQTTAVNDNDQAKADLAVAESNLKQAQNNFQRSKDLFDKNLISAADRDQAEVDRVRAEAQLVKAKANLSSTEDRLHDTRVVAPITGVILSRTVSLGQIISSAVSNVGGGTLLGTIADMDEVYVETNVDEVDIGRVQVGQSAKVVADAFPDDAFRGEVIRIAPLGKTSQNVTTFSVIILVRNIGGKLKAGMSASVDIEIFNRQNVLLLPADAFKDPRTEQGRVLMAAIRERQSAESPKTDSVKTNESSASPVPTNPDEFRQRMASMSPEEQQKYREQMRQRFQNMSQEDRQRFFSQMRGQFGGQGGGFGGGMRRQTQTERPDAPKDRIVEVRVGTEFVPKIVKVGAANYDFGEVLEGLKEGDEVRITTISRAKIAADQMNQRMRNMSGVGGIGGGRR